MMKSERRASILILFLLFSYLFRITISVQGSGEQEDTTSAESTMTMELIHRDDPRVAGEEIKSGGERFQELVEIDSNRYERIGKRLGQSAGRKEKGGRYNSTGQYLVPVWVGTPSQKYLVTADMASALIWLNCRYDSGDAKSFGGWKSLFDAGNSSTFQTLPCSSRLCNTDLSPLFSHRTCPNASNLCEYDYSYRYGDAYHAKGVFGTDTIAILLRDGTTEKMHDMVIGCTTDGGTLTEDGVLGLGIANGTLVDRLASRNGGKFSYCLGDHLSEKNSYLTFGDITRFKRGLLSRIQYTKPVEVPPYHAAHLVNISVGDQILPLPPETFDLTVNNGIVVMDSGSSLTTLPSPVYDAVINVLKKCFKNYSESKPTGGMQYCYKAPGFDVNSLPKLVLYFPKGVRFEPPLKSYIVDVGPQVKCLGLLRGGGRIFVLGNMMLQNHTWQFDLFNRTLGFATSTCP